MSGRVPVPLNVPRPGHGLILPYLEDRFSAKRTLIVASDRPRTDTSMTRVGLVAVGRLAGTCRGSYRFHRASWLGLIRRSTCATVSPAGRAGRTVRVGAVSLALAAS
jgi:hypothetical protein